MIVATLEDFIVFLLSQEMNDKALNTPDEFRQQPSCFDTAICLFPATSPT
jgi:hypothetical protein